MASNITQQIYSYRTLGRNQSQKIGKNDTLINSDWLFSLTPFRMPFPQACFHRMTYREQPNTLSLSASGMCPTSGMLNIPLENGHTLLPANGFLGRLILNDLALCALVKYFF